MSQFLAIAFAVACLIGALYILRRPHWAVLVILLMHPLEQILQANFPALRATPWIINLCVGLLAGVAIISRLLHRDQVTRGLYNGVWFGVVLMYALVWISLAWSPSAGNALPQLITGIPYFALFFICTPLLLSDLREFRRLLIGIMVVGLVLALFIFINPSSTYFRGRLVLEMGAFSGQTTSNPLALATMGGIIAIIAALIRPERSSRLLNLLRIAAFVLGLGLAIGSGSRGQVIAAGVAGIVFYPIARQMARPGQFFLAVAGFAILLLGVYVTFRLFVTDVNRARWDVFDMAGDTTGRYDMVVSLFEVWLSEPSSWLLGLGVNAFTSVGSGRIGYVHNLVAEVLCELGIVGAMLLAAAAFCSWRHGRFLLKRYRDDPSLRSVTAILGAMWVYSLLLALKQGSFCLNPAVILWWVVLGTVGLVEMKSLVQAWATDHEDTPDEHEAFDEFDEYDEFDEDYVFAS